MDSEPKDAAIQNATSYLLGIYDICLNEKGQLCEYWLINSESEAKGIIRYAYIEIFSSFVKSPGWFNGATYVDTLSKEATGKFTEIIHEKYKKSVGEYFGKPFLPFLQMSLSLTGIKIYLRQTAASMPLPLGHLPLLKPFSILMVIV